jgi:hypothetical protein
MKKKYTIILPKEKEFSNLVCATLRGAYLAIKRTSNNDFEYRVYKLEGNEIIEIETDAISFIESLQAEFSNFNVDITYKSTLKDTDKLKQLKDRMSEYNKVTLIP